MLPKKKNLQTVNHSSKGQNKTLFNLLNDHQNLNTSFLDFMCYNSHVITAG